MMSSSCDSSSLTVLPLEVNHANSVWWISAEADKNVPDKQAGKLIRSNDEAIGAIVLLLCSRRQLVPLLLLLKFDDRFFLFCASRCSLFDLFLMNFNWSFSETDPSLDKIRQQQKQKQRPHGKPIKNATKIKTNAENETGISTPFPPPHLYVYYAS